VHVFNCSVQRVHRDSFAATTVSALRGQSVVTSEWTVLMDLMSTDVVSIPLCVIIFRSKNYAAPIRAVASHCKNVIRH